MRKVSLRRQKRNREAAKARHDLVCEVGACEYCHRSDRGLCVHEILRGIGYRSKAQDKRFATLVLCDDCHREMDGRDWAEQLAILRRSRAEDFALADFHKLAGRRKPDLEEVRLWGLRLGTF